MDIYTIGHSTHHMDVFIKMLKQHKIDILVDIRSYPGSRRFPQFNKEIMSGWLGENGIEYKHIPSLGGRRRKLKTDSHNQSWKNVSFRNYADYTSLKEFDEGLQKLIDLAKENRVCYMCSEAVPWRCHRSIVSDNLIARGVNVHHIMPYNRSTKITEHKLGSWGAKPIIEDGKVIYPLQHEQMSLSL